MEGKRIKVFGVIMSLLLVLSFAATFSVSSTSVVSAGTQKWTKISIPNTDNMQLAPGTDVGAIAVSPDGGTLFAAVFVYDSTLLPLTYADNTWYILKSVDDGYTWKNTGYADDGSDIVAIKISPDWVNDGRLYVATETDVYYSKNRGSTFASRGATTFGDITSMDVGLDANGDVTVIIGTSGIPGDVYVLDEDGWQAQLIYDASTGGYANNANGVLAVAFSPNYGQDGVVFAVITGTLMGSTGTILRAASDISVHNWGAYINDAHFIDKPTGDTIVAESACMAFAEDYNFSPAAFVGLVAYDGVESRGDAFVIQMVMGAIGTSAVEDLNIRGQDTRTNVYSLAVSGSSTSAFILAGLRNLSNDGPMSSWQGTVHYSQNGGESWLQSYKPPSGMDLATQLTAPVVVMAPDFEDSGIAYCGNGYIPGVGIPGMGLMFSGFYASSTWGTTFNGRGLIDHTIDQILDILPSPDYDNDSTLFMVTDWITMMGLLWETKDGGSKWELILGMTTMIPLPGFAIDTVEIPSFFPYEPSVFVYAPDGITGTNSGFVRSNDEGNLFATTIRGPYIGSTPQVIDAWKVIDQNTIIVASGSDMWKTTNMGAHWIKSGTDSTNDISTTENVIDMQLWNDTTIIVGTDGGNVYICQNWETDFSFTQVGSSPGIAGDEVRVAFDSNYDDTGMIYAGVLGTEEGVWRVNVNSGDNWENIWDDDDILAIACDGNGILWAIAGNGDPIREVHPTSPIDKIAFEWVLDGLTSDLWTDLETAPTQTYVFAIGGVGNLELWAYIDTLIKPTLISPANGATAAGNIIQGQPWARVVLNWEEMPKATWYEYQVAYDSGFGSIADTDIVEGTIAEMNLYLGEKFYWRVRAYEPIYSQWSDTWSFTTPLGPASAKPVCLSPTEGEMDVILKPVLQWSSAVQATGWELMVAKNCDYSDTVVNLQGSSALPADTTAYQITQNLMQGTNYCWKVRGINSATGTVSPWSDTGTFTTLTIVVEEEEGTPVWVWVVIALSAVLLVGVVVLIIRTRRPV
ncbi:MAG: hypothetical protein WC333_08530 [Dehalococcoidia bacterium]